jgi:predicted RNA-binding protein YlqC (UPF0109 family)
MSLDAKVGSIEGSDAHRVSFRLRGCTNQTYARRRQEQSDLASRRDRPAFATRRPLPRGARPVQPADRSFDDRARRGARAQLAPEGSSAERYRQAPAEGKGDRLKELLEFLARTLVDQPDKVEVREYEEDDETVLLELSVPDDDRGKVIGRQGRTAKALRSVMKASGVKEGKRVLVEIVE